MKKMMLILLAVTMISLLAACSSGTKRTEAGSTASAGNSENAEAPHFTLTDTDGKTHSLSDYAGKKVYVKFWASWCSICLAGLEEVDALAKSDEDFVVLTIVSPGYKNEKETEAFKKWFSGVEEAANTTVLLDEGGKVADEFGVRGYPTSAYIDSEGKLIQTLPGHAGNEQITEKFASIK
ncbi:TlpA disulfide reductase family protein [Paenibacillus polygoni]|uniref:TlpA disulfide reductase family protein n=1 Tax=Paenibacillus polygoni TaxID=3050112 RepID=A0ABY8X2E6_9BACL|nr:TlpA disulfide reductase family protein [Paenibacillus polygoni]WIV19173.1 TlpA disulfide reductase family protein [Paenibacillus polygoni]